MPHCSDQYLSPSDVADSYPGLSKRWLARRRGRAEGPTYIKVGKRILYRRSDIERFLDQCAIVLE